MSKLTNVFFAQGLSSESGFPTSRDIAEPKEPNCPSSNGDIERMNLSITRIPLAFVFIFSLPILFPNHSHGTVDNGPAEFEVKGMEAPIRIIPISEAIDVLTSGREKEIPNAMASLKASGKSAIKPILSAILTHQRFDQVGHLSLAVESIVSNPDNRDGDVLNQIAQAIEVSSRAVATNLVPSLATFKGDKRATAILREIAHTNKNPSVRGVAVGTLFAQLNNPLDATEDFRSLLSDSDEHVQMAAARALGRLGKNDGRDKTLEILRRPMKLHRDPTLILAAANAAGTIGGLDFVTALENLLADPEGRRFGGWIVEALNETRLTNCSTPAEKLVFLASLLPQSNRSEWAASRIARIGSPEALDLLRRTASDSTNPGSNAAEHALRWAEEQKKIRSGSK